jgi:hypothetical protein
VIIPPAKTQPKADQPSLGLSQALPNKIRNPKLEIRNKQQSNKAKPEKIQNANPKYPVSNIGLFDHLKLFRISDFEF